MSSCVVCVYKRMLKHGDTWWTHYMKDHPAPPDPFEVHVCGRHESELMGRAIAYESPRVVPVHGYELYPHGVDT